MSERVDPGTILVVDDDIVNRLTLSYQLEAEGYTVAVAEDGRQALGLLRAQPFDLVLLDILMPELDGYQVLARLKSDEVLRHLPVIVLSALEEMDSILRCIEMGAADYLSKPFDLVLLRARIGACLEKKRLHDREVAHLRTIEAQAAELTEWNRTLEERVRQQVEQLERLGRLRRFLGPQLAEVIVSSDSESLLEIHRREIAVVFTDLRGFTPFVESTEPESMARVLREYHEAMGSIIFSFQGTVGNFVGDGLMIFFNDPLPCPDAAAQAVRMAVAMRSRMDELIALWRERGHELGFGVGVAYGSATIGKIGFEGRFDYQPNGGVVNLAARLCSQARHGQILISQSVHILAGGLAVVEPVGEVRLKGFLRPIPVYNVVELADGEPG
ncbi:MAG: response regulator [Chloroflexi bacterium]|nr:response regulator [Chloroflexota bacterium]